MFVTLCRVSIATVASYCATKWCSGRGTPEHSPPPRNMERAAGGGGLDAHAHARKREIGAPPAPPDSQLPYCIPLPFT